MGNTAWITGRATTMRALTTLAQFSLLAFSCQALKITDNCSSGAQCSQELNGFRGAESVQNCQGAQCDIDFGRQPSQGRPQNNQQGFNRDRPQNNRPTFNQGSRPNNNQPGRVTITDNCSSGAQCSQNLNGNVVDSTQNCRGAQCDVNFGGSRGSGGNGGAVAGNNGFGGGGNRGVAGNNGFGAGGNRGVAGNNGFGGGGTGGVTVNRECVGNRCTVNTNGAGNNGFGGAGNNGGFGGAGNNGGFGGAGNNGGFGGAANNGGFGGAANNGGFGGGNSGIGGGATGRIETVNCGQGVRTASTSVNGVIQVTCLNGNTVMNCSNTKIIFIFLYIRKPPTAHQGVSLCDPMMDIKSLYSVTVGRPLEEIREDEEEEMKGEEEEEEEE